MQKKLTKGEKNAKKSEEYNARVAAIGEFGYTIKSYRFAGEYPCNIYKNGDCLNGTYECHGEALVDAEWMVTKYKIEKGL